LKHAICLYPGFLNLGGVKGSQAGLENGSDSLLRRINCIVFIIRKFIIISL